MKKILLLFSILLIGINLSLLAKIVDINNARLVGKNGFYEQVNRMNITPYNSISITSEFVIKHNSDPVYYVFNINDKGYIIVSAEDAIEPVLGFSFETSYTTENQSPEFIFWMNTYKEQINIARQLNLIASTKIRSGWAHLLVSDATHLTSRLAPLDVAPLLTCNWNQDFPYNQMCPADPACTGSNQGHVLVGCVATSMSQVMYYWRYPWTGQGYHCDNQWYNGQQYCANFDTTHYNWNGMTDNMLVQCDPEALLCYHAAVAVNMGFGCNASGAYANAVPNALHSYFKYSSTVNYQNRFSDSTSWKNKMRDNLDAAEPLIYTGQGPEGGHMWVCDGYQGSNFFHFNWGWGGQQNGYFSINNINPSPYTFNYSQGAVFDVMPDPAYYPPYCSGLNDLSAYTFGSFEDGSGPVADYHNSANCSWLIAPNDSISHITLSFDKFNVDPSDQVNVYDGADQNAPLLGSYTGNTPPSNVVSTGGKMFITFISNSSNTASGFLALYNATLANFCTGLTHLTDPAGDFSDGSVNYPYRNGSVCRWLIEPSGASTLTLSFSNFKTEATNDKLDIYNYITNALLASYSGDYTTPPADVICNCSKMYVVFTSNGSVRDDGWNANYTMYPVGIDDRKAFDNLMIYPNPAEGLVNLNFYLNDNQTVKIEVLSLNGVSVYHESLPGLKGNIDRQLNLNSLPKGVYLLRLISEKAIVNKKITIE
jgi:hypothetical protein